MRAAPSRRKHADMYSKRTFDIVGGTLLALVVLPVIVVLAVVSALVFRAWPFFCQDRVGRDGRTIRVVKIRSLAPATPSGADKYELQQLQHRRFGRFIRGTHLDELPQLFLVPIGRMSLVGPRPEMPHIALRFSPEQRAAREQLRPGCTGLWQVSSAADRMMHEAPEFDLFYAAHRSLRLDLWILWRTARQSIVAGSVSLDSLPSWSGTRALVASAALDDVRTA